MTSAKEQLSLLIGSPFWPFGSCKVFIKSVNLLPRGTKINVGPSPGIRHETRLEAYSFTILFNPVSPMKIFLVGVKANRIPKMQSLAPLGLRTRLVAS
jgi:hypothetical protein